MWYVELVLFGKAAGLAKVEGILRVNTKIASYEKARYSSHALSFK